MNSEQYRAEQYSFNKEIDEKKNFSEKIVEHFEIHPVRRLLRSSEIFSKSTLVIIHLLMINF